MPYLGEIRSSKDIPNPHKKARHIYIKCPNCGKERWLILGDYKTSVHKGLCSRCACTLLQTGKYKEKHPKWKGGRYESTWGYILVKLNPNDDYYPMMTRQGTVFEHRLVMAQHLGRCLELWEEVHHINGIRTDNRIENLELTSREKHHQVTVLTNIINAQNKRITQLEAEFTLLRTQMELNEFCRINNSTS